MERHLICLRWNKRDLRDLGLGIITCIMLAICFGVIIWVAATVAANWEAAA